MAPNDARPLDHEPDDQEAYRFEVGGGHWIFGGDEATLAELERRRELRVYERCASVRIGDLDVTTPYPLQAHVDRLGSQTRDRVAREMSTANGSSGPPATLGAWLDASFGETLCGVFFRPFHDRYTAGLTDRIAPQDPYKSPTPGQQGYNATFRYPVGGLDVLARDLASECDVRYGQAVATIDPDRRTVVLGDGTEHRYGRLLSTLPLDRALAMAGVAIGEPADPHTSVLVVNVGGARGGSCPTCHWQYEPDSRAGFHRVGFYSNVEPAFLPASRRDGSHVSMYVEHAFLGGSAPRPAEVTALTDATVRELIDRDYLATVDVVHPSWVDVAYTWRWPGSSWRESALQALADAGITQIGRYGRWEFQGIAESIREGFTAGAAVR
jgi:protoporphyrinogen oxidase